MRWTINALLKRTDRQRGEARRSKGRREVERDADVAAGKKVKRGEKQWQLSNSIKIPARMLPAPKLKAAAAAEEDEDVAQSDRLRDELAETKTELLSSCTLLPPFYIATSLARERRRLRLQLQRTLAAFALISLPQRELR